MQGFIDRFSWQGKAGQGKAWQGGARLGGAVRARHGNVRYGTARFYQFQPAPRDLMTRQGASNQEWNKCAFKSN